MALHMTLASIVFHVTLQSIFRKRKDNFDSDWNVKLLFLVNFLCLFLVIKLSMANDA